MSCLYYLFWLDPRIIFCEKYRARSSSLRNLLQSPVGSFHLDPSVLLSTLFSQTLSIYFSLSVSDQVLHPCITKVRIIILYSTYSYTILKLKSFISNFEFLKSRRARIVSGYLDKEDCILTIHLLIPILFKYILRFYFKVNTLNFNCLSPEKKKKQKKTSLLRWQIFISRHSLIFQ